MSKVLVISPKGGCGKSTITFQILAPYFYSLKNQKPTVIDLDTANNEHKTFTRSSIINLREEKILTLDPLLSMLDEDLIIDTGATSLAYKAIQKIDEIDLINYIDLFLIPITRGKQSTSSALDMYDQIKELKSDAKVCFALNDVYDVEEEIPLEMQFIDFLGDKIHSCYLDHEQGKFDQLKAKDPNVSYIVVPQVTCLYWVSQFAVTAFELAEKVEELRLRRENLIDAAKTDPNKQAEARLTSYKMQLAKRCLNFRKKILENNIFNELSKIIG